MSEPEYQNEWDNEVRNSIADERYEQWVAEQNYELDDEAHWSDLSGVEDDDAWSLRDEARGVL